MTVSWTIPNRPEPFSFLLKEDFFFLLLEGGGNDDDRIIINVSSWSDRTDIPAGWVN
jgi:hypothetical protein